MSDATTLTQRALAAIRQLKRRVATLEAQKREPIAIISAACRFPGGPTPEAYWDTLRAGRDMIREVPDARLLGPWPEGVPRWAGLLDSVDGFDPAFFGISPREALVLDPQQRMLLELAWEALERAPIVPARLRETKTGVFVGMSQLDYLDRVALIHPDQPSVYDLLGNADSPAAGRISYVLGLQGPAMTVDTACSTSLVAIHLACQSLRVGDSTLALVGGVNLILTERTTEALSHTQALAPDGRCKTFDSRANGFVRGEGAGMLVLKRLSEARRDGDRILGVIRGSAVNQDGRSTGLTAPNVLAQERLLREALDNAGLEAHELDYVECHGTGTSLGDPIEVQALSTVLGEREGRSPLWLGAVKSNIGHLEAAAGLAGVIKVLLAFEHEALPPNLHLRHVNPYVAMGEGLSPVRELTAWGSGPAPRRAGVSSFGISGTNAHVILEQAPPAPEPEPRERASRRVWAVPVSGQCEAALVGQAARLRAQVSGQIASSEGAQTELLDLAHALATTRTPMAHRACAVVSSAEELAEALEALEAGEAAPQLVRSTARADGQVVFVFPGQGSQWLGMARGLLDESPAFRRTLEACAAALDPLTGWSLIERLRSEDPEALAPVEVIQPALFAMMLGLAAVWRELGVTPDAVIGHSQGEIAAACVAGALSLEDAARVVALRSQIIAEQLRGAGAMALVSQPAAALEARLADAPALPVSVAVDNGPGSSVVSGEPQAVAALLALLQSEGVFARAIQVDYASHCGAVERTREALLARLGALEPRAAELPMLSTVTAAPVHGAELDAGYWYRNLRQRVRFGEAIEAAIDEGHAVFVEVSPHPVLTLAMAEVLDAREARGAVLGTLRRDEGGLARALTSLGELHCAGGPVDWSAHFEAYAPRPVDLPTYAFARERYWIDALAHGGARDDLDSAGMLPVRHALLGAVTRVGQRDELVLTTNLSLRRHPWLGDHRVQGSALLPGAGFIDLALSAARLAWPDSKALGIDELLLTSPLVLDDADQTLQVVLDAPDAQGRRALQIVSRPSSEPLDGEVTLHA
ncbi:modular polyketide synthase, partial [Plesiocystis pacifica SIR-1]